MKWWYVLVIFVGVALGLILLSNNRKINKDNLTIVDRAGMRGEVANLPTIITTSKKGEEKNTYQLTGIVKSWSNKDGLIEVKAAGKIWQFYLDPTEMMIFIPSIKNKNQILMVSNKEGLRWETAFCETDNVDVRVENEKVMAITIVVIIAQMIRNVG